MKLSRLALLAVAGLCAVAAPLAHADNSAVFHRSYTVTGLIDLTVSTGSGAVQVTGVPGDTVTIDGTVHQSVNWLFAGNADRMHEIVTNPPISQSGGQITVSRPELGWNDSIWISYVITVPTRARVNVHAGSGSLTVGGVSGDVEATAGSGHIRAAALGGGFQAHTGSGDIDFDRVAGATRCTASSGDIDGNDVGGEFYGQTSSGSITVGRLERGGEAHASSGSVRLDNVAGSLTVSTASGSVRASGDLGPQADWHLHTSSGSVNVNLPASAAATLDLHTSSGSVTVDQPMRTHGRLERHDWSGEIGAGSPTAQLSITTSSGGIHIH